MKDSFIHILKSQNISETPVVEYDRFSKQLAHLYPSVNLETSRFKQEINLFVKRKESFSGNVLTVHKIRDQHISLDQENPSMQISVLTDYVPWRLHLLGRTITYQEALFLLAGSFRGFRELLHRLRFPFLVEDYMIGIDINGNVRVWWNKDFYKNKFPFTLTSDIKLKDMVISLVKLVTSKMGGRDRQVLQQNLFTKGETTFLALEHSIQIMSNGLKLKVVGMNMLYQLPEVAKAMNYLKQLNAPPITTVTTITRTPYHSRLIHTQQVKSQQRIIISPGRSQLDNELSRGRLISKRTYQSGFSPNNLQKMKIIKNDIENLRFNTYPERAMTLRTSKSVNNLCSINKGIRGNPQIPQINLAMKHSQIIAANQDMTVSRFIEPSKSVIITLPGNPQICNACTGVSRLRRSEIIVEPMAPLQLSRIRSLQNLSPEKEIFSTERSNNESKMGASYLKRFGESEKKLPENKYFSRLIES